MTEQFPINAAAAEQRLVEELTGHTPQGETGHARDAPEPGDPQESPTPDNEIRVGGRVEVEDPRENA